MHLYVHGYLLQPDNLDVFLGTIEVIARSFLILQTDHDVSQKNSIRVQKLSVMIGVNFMIVWRR